MGTFDRTSITRLLVCGFVTFSNGMLKEHLNRFDFWLHEYQNSNADSFYSFCVDADDCWQKCNNCNFLSRKDERAFYFINLNCIDEINKLMIFNVFWMGRIKNMPHKSARSQEHYS